MDRAAWRRTELLFFIPMLPWVAARLIWELVRLHLLKRPVPEMLKAMVGSPNQRPWRRPSAREQKRLIILWRLSNFILVRLFRAARPCLPRSIFLLRWCRQKGLAACLVIGVRKEDKGLAGHSWLELADRPLAEYEAGLTTYTPMLRACTTTGLTHDGREIELKELGPDI